MSVTKNFYPSSIVISSPSTTIRTFENLRAGFDFEQFSQAAGGTAGVSFVGNHVSRPMFTADVLEVKKILDLTNGSYNVLRDLSAGNVDVEYRAGTDKGDRTAIASLAHVRARMASNCLLTWNRITARQGELANIGTTWHACYDGTNAPLIPTSGVAISGSGNVGDLFTLGPLDVNGSQVQGCEEVTIENNLEYEILFADGEAWPSYVAIARIVPTISFRNRNHDLFASYGTAGTAVTSWAFYLRKRQPNGLLVANATAEHIKLSGTTGVITTEEVADGVNCQIRLSEDSGAFYTIDTTSAIT